MKLHLQENTERIPRVTSRSDLIAMLWLRQCCNLTAGDERAIDSNLRFIMPTQSLAHNTHALDDDSDETEENPHTHTPFANMSLQHESQSSIDDPTLAQFSDQTDWV